MGYGTVNVGYPAKIGKPGGSDAYGSAAAVQTNLTSHINNKSNPHGVTAAQAGALPITGGTLTGNLTGLYITGTWLQGTADNHLSTTPPKVCVQDADGWVHHRTPAEIRSDIGAAASSHTHSASDINSGTLSAARGGTGQTTLTPAVTTKGVRQIYAGTSDMTAGSSSLTTGVIYLVYE